MILTVLTPSVATLIAFAFFSIVVLLSFAIAHAKRDVTVEITFFKLR